MPWGKIDDSLYDHPKLDELPPAMRMPCVGLWAVAISWCNRRLTDGHVPKGRIRLLGGTIQQAEALVSVRLFDKEGDGYRVHDFLDFNDSREYVMSRRAADATRQRLLRESRVESQRDTGRDTKRSHSVTDGVTPHVSPSPARGRVPGPSSPVPAIPGPTDTDGARDGEPLSDEETDLFAYLANQGAFIRPESGFGVRLQGLIERRGVEVVMEMARTMTTDTRHSDREWVFGLEKALEAIPSPPMEALPEGPSPSEMRSQRVQEKAAAARLEYFSHTGKWDPAFGPEPEWNPEWGERPAPSKVAA
jgi:hypothetical protein